VEITPASTPANTYTVRMANNDATVDLCPIAIHSSKIANLNPWFYHKIRHPLGSDNAEIKLFFDSGTDGNYDGMDQWSVPEASMWNDISSVVVSADNVMKSDWANYSNDPFILVNEKEPSVIIPNVFSPDADGTNDLFVVSDANFEEFHIEILDRWGVKMFESYSAEKPWDGTNIQGLPATEGTYFYILKAITRKTKTDFGTTGFLTLLRKK
jgi:gliding motility-associated-like protein